VRVHTFKQTGQVVFFKNRNARFLFVLVTLPSLSLSRSHWQVASILVNLLGCAKSGRRALRIAVFSAVSALNVVKFHKIFFRGGKKIKIPVPTRSTGLQ